MSRKQAKLILILTGLAIVGLIAISVPFVISSVSQNIKKSEVKAQVSQKLGGRQDFSVTDILVESNGWEVAKIESNNSEDPGNPGLVILHQENGQMILKFGPGTYFDKAALDAAGVPLNIENVVVSDKYVSDPILNYLPHQTSFYSVSYIGFKPTQLKVTVFEVPRLNIYSTQAKRDQYTIEIKDWIRSLGLDPSNYTLVFTT
jgi:hypothetical protein